MFDESKIIIDLIPKSNKNRPGFTMASEYITVHDTGNESTGADALMHASYVKNSSTTSSWHFTVDDKNIVQHLPLDENGWHAGDGNTGTGNRRSIGIEICMNKGIDRVKAEENAAELIVYLMKKCNIPIDNVVQHNHWSGKDCPKLIRSRKNGWITFMALVWDKNKIQSIPDWQVAAFKSLIQKGIIKSPEYWDSRLNETITIGEMMAILNNLG